MLKEDILALNIKHSFAMPGHKGELSCHDITEIYGADDLREPNGILKAVEDNLAIAFNSYKSYISVQGSTLGNFAMVYSAYLTYPNKKRVLTNANPHISIINICKVLGLELVISDDIIIDKDTLCVILTYPTYFGNCISNIEEIIAQAHLQNIPVFIDNAHGAHFAFSDKLPKTPMELGCVAAAEGNPAKQGIDASVTSVHKTLPCLGQTAVINLSHNSLVSEDTMKEAINIFQTTSPSYLLMSSIDSGVRYMQAEGKERLNWLIERCNKIRDKYKHILTDDPTKIVLINPDLDKLHRAGIWEERIENHKVLFLPSVANTDEDFEALEDNFQSLSGSI